MFASSSERQRDTGFRFGLLEFNDDRGGGGGVDDNNVLATVATTTAVARDLP